MNKEQLLELAPRTFPGRSWDFALTDLLSSIERNGFTLKLIPKNDTIWDTFVKELGNKLNFSSEVINDFLDGFGSYYDVGQPDHWPEMLFKIERWIAYNIGKRDAFPQSDG
jgi:hypothetical protein